MRALALFTLGLALFATGPSIAQHAAPGAPPPGRVAQIVEQLRGGGHVLVIRHERTEVPSRDDDYSRPAHDCSVQRNLSVAGLASARETGVSIRALGIPIDRVITSPMCRGTDTARMMFGNEYQLDPRLMHHNPALTDGLARATESFREVLREIGGSADNIVLISHAGNISTATGLRLVEGEIGVLKVDAEGQVTTVGQVHGSELGFPARAALAASPVQP